MDRQCVDAIRKRIRVSTQDSKEEVQDLIEAAKKDMSTKGIQGDEKDPLYFQALVLYCKANYGYDEDTERFQKAYESLRDSMSLSGDYRKRSD